MRIAELKICLKMEAKRLKDRSLKLSIMKYLNINVAILLSLIALISLDYNLENRHNSF